VTVLVRTFPAQRAVLREIRQFIRQQAREHAFADEAESLALISGGTESRPGTRVRLVQYRDN